MKIAFRDEDYLILDDIFSAPEFEEIRKLFFAEDLKLVGHFDAKAFSVADGVAYRAGPHTFSMRSGTASHIGNGTRFLPFIQKIVSVQKEHFPLTYENVGVTPWCYTQGTGLTWHNDAGPGYEGSYVFYVHSEWRATWGGQLLIAKNESDGRYFYPKPNRLVLMRRGVPHSIQRVDTNAGENCRLSLSGFFLRMV